LLELVTVRWNAKAKFCAQNVDFSNEISVRHHSNDKYQVSWMKWIGIHKN
jgi:hypothetical protein